MANHYQYQGRLSETSLPEMLSSIHRFRVPGVIEARHGDVKKRVLIREGYVIHASSSDRKDSLGDYLVRTGRLSQQAFNDVSRLRRSTEQRFGTLLLERGLLFPGDVFRAIRQHVEEIVWSLFFWQRGEITFQIGEVENEGMIQIQLPMRRVILEGIQRAPDARALVGRLGKKETVLEPSFHWEDLIEIGLTETEYNMLMLVDGQRSLYQLCSDGPLSAGDNAKLLYAFQVLHLVAARTGAAAKEDTEPARPLKIKLNTDDPKVS